MGRPAGCANSAACRADMFAPEWGPSQSGQRGGSRPAVRQGSTGASTRSGRPTASSWTPGTPTARAGAAVPGADALAARTPGWSRGTTISRSPSPTLGSASEAVPGGGQGERRRGVRSGWGCSHNRLGYEPRPFGLSGLGNPALTAAGGPGAHSGHMNPTGNGSTTRASRSTPYRSARSRAGIRRTTTRRSPTSTRRTSTSRGWTRTMQWMAGPNGSWQGPRRGPRSRGPGRRGRRPSGRARRVGAG